MCLPWSRAWCLPKAFLGRWVFGEDLKKERGRMYGSFIWASISSSAFVCKAYLLLQCCPCHAGGSASYSACSFSLHCWICCSWTLYSSWLLVNYCLLPTFNYLLPSYLSATSSQLALPFWWWLLHALVKSISFAFGLLWPLSYLSLSLLPCLFCWMLWNTFPTWALLVLLQLSWFFLDHQHPAASFLYNLVHTCLCRASECWWNSFALSPLLLLCMPWCPLPLQFPPSVLFLALLVVWVSFHWCPN